MGCLTSSSSSYSCSCVCVCAASRVHRHVQDVERADTEAQRDYLRHADDRYKTELHVHVGGVAGGFGEDQVRDLVSFLFFFLDFEDFGSGFSRDETFAKVSDVHRTIFDYVMLIFDGFKSVIEDVSLSYCHFDTWRLGILALFDPRGRRLLLIYCWSVMIRCYERKL